MERPTITVELINELVDAHYRACEVWEHGNVVKHWIDEDNNICIQFSDGAWYHYKIDYDTRDIIFW